MSEYEDILNDLRGLIEKSKADLGEKFNSDKLGIQLQKQVDCLEKGDIHGFLAIATSITKVIDPPSLIKGRHTAEDKNYLAYAEWTEASHGMLVDENNPIRRYVDKESITRRISELENDHQKFSKSELIKKLSAVTLKNELLAAKLKATEDHCKFLSDKYGKSLEKRLETVGKQSKAKDKLFSSNNAYLKHCLNQVTDNGVKTVNPNDFLKFQAIAKKNPPAFIQNPRRSKQDRMMSEEIQKLDAEALARNEWAPSTLRNFFEKHTGVKPSSVRK